MDYRSSRMVSIMNKKGTRLFLLIIVSIWIFFMSIVELIKFLIHIPFLFARNLIMIKKPIKEK
jgi:hypothetical protein